MRIRARIGSSSSVARDVCLIVNPHAGGGRAARRLPGVEAELRARGVAFHTVQTRSLDHARELARAALAAGETAVAMGGDGVTGAVAGELRETDGVLGVIPGGRGNDFARKLGVPMNATAAVGVVAAGRVRTVDVADAGGHTYLGVASAGLDSDVQRIANGTRLPLGNGVYVYGTLRALARWEPADWTVTLDGVEHRFRGYSVSVCNSGVFGAGMHLAPMARMDDGLLDVMFNAECSRPHFLSGLARVFRGTHVHDFNVSFFTAREVTFSADRPFTAYADGDPIVELPATFKVVPDGLRVLVP
jgi:YegS/Rv2252/BmrU family lipid kinase